MKGPPMHLKELLKSGCASMVAAAMMLQPVAMAAQNAQNVVVTAPPSSATYAGWRPDHRKRQELLTQAPSRSYGSTSRLYHSVSSMRALKRAEKLALLQRNLKYVFVIFQENRSYDHYFGTYPGANGLFATTPAQTTRTLLLSRASTCRASPPRSRRSPPTAP